jgi:hypothetical protein
LLIVRYLAGIWGVGISRCRKCKLGKCLASFFFDALGLVEFNGQCHCGPQQDAFGSGFGNEDIFAGDAQKRGEVSG